MKSIFASKTFWGAVISLLSQVAPHLLVSIGLTPDAATEYLAHIAQEVLIVIGFALTIYGRYKANRSVSLTGAKGEK